MQLGHDDFRSRHALAGVNVGRNATAIVRDGDRTVGVEGHGDDVGMSGQRLVDRIVDDLVDHVMQAGTVIGITDIHARTLANGIQPLEHLDRIRTIFG